MICGRCNGSGELGASMRGSREVPGPVPEDARRFRAITCPTCCGTGDISNVETEDDDDE